MDRDTIQRSVLPIPDTQYSGLITFDARDPASKFAPIAPLRPPSGAPNVLVILLDDVGFGASSAFGGPCRTPVIERLAANGLKYSRFHTTALCSPTRQALLTGRNHHSCGQGSVGELATAAPGYTGIRPKSMAPLAEILRLNGYGTAQFGKCHEVPLWETSSAGPFDRWPTGSGFEHFYGFIGGDTHQYYPALYNGTTPIEPEEGPEDGYHLTEDLVDRTIAWTRQQKALAPDKPFFIYFAPGATHAPHHVPLAWADKYKGQFDGGWDKLRQQIFARQKELGVVSKDAELTARHDEVPAWDDVSDEMKPILARQMEIYAGFLEHTDHHVGRMIDALADLEVLDDTLILYIIGDNGASAEGGLNGTFNEMLQLTGFGHFETPEFLAERLHLFGGPEAFNHYSACWAHALDTPYQWTKQVASHFGGTRNGTVIHWPNGFKSRGEVRNQFCHVIDVAPTVLEAAGLPHPAFVNGTEQSPIEGTSMVYTFDEEKAPERHETQYFEISANRGIYHQGWTACAIHRVPWVTTSKLTFDDDVWELYDTSSDWSQARNIANKHPEKLEELKRLFIIEATKYKVLPIDNRFIERANPEIAGRPTLIRGNTQLFYKGMGRLNENCVIIIKNKSHSVTAQITVGDDPAHGVIISQGGNGGGWSLYALNGRLKYCYNLMGLSCAFAESEAPIPSGGHQVRMEFDYDGGGVGKGGNISIFIDGKAVGTGRIDVTQPAVFSADETTDVGRDNGTPVSPDFKSCHGTDFNGDIEWVQIDVDAAAEDVDHLITPEERFRVAMARQ